MSCEKMKRFQIRTESEWLREHYTHGKKVIVMCEEQPPKGTYTLLETQCPCGAKFISTTNDPSGLDIRNMNEGLPVPVEIDDSLPDDHFELRDGKGTVAIRGKL